MENVQAVQGIAAQLSDQTEPRERAAVKAEVDELLKRWGSLKVMVADRSKALEENLGRALFSKWSASALLAACHRLSNKFP